MKYSALFTIVKVRKKNKWKEAGKPYRRIKPHFDRGTLMKKIIVADDSRLIRMKLKKHLVDHFTIIEAENGRDALVKVKIEQPDIILTDLLMPEMDGFELLAQLQSKKLEIPVVVLTADIQHETMVKCTELGAFKVLNKPPNKEILLNTLDSALQNQEA